MARDKSDTAPKPAIDPEILKQFQALTDYEERKKFFAAHPELATLYSPGNFH